MRWPSIGDSYESCATNVKHTMRSLEDLAFVVNKVPSNKCKYADFILDSNKLSVELTDKEKIILLSC